MGLSKLMKKVEDGMEAKGCERAAETDCPVMEEEAARRPDQYRTGSQAERRGARGRGGGPRMKKGVW